MMSSRVGPTHVNVSEIVSPAPSTAASPLPSSSGRQATSRVPSAAVTSSAVPPTSSSSSSPPTTQLRARRPPRTYSRGRGVGEVDRRVRDQSRVTAASPTGTPERVAVVSLSRVAAPGRMSAPSGAATVRSTVGGRGSPTTTVTEPR